MSLPLSPQEHESMKIRCLAVPALLACALIVGACSSSQTKSDKAATPAKASMGLMNSKCPMQGEPVDKDDPTTDYKGGKVAFCCKNCMAKFQKLTPEQQAQKVAAAK
jgi:hypothetical protein